MRRSHYVIKGNIVYGVVGGVSGRIDGRAMRVRTLRNS